MAHVASLTEYTGPESTHASFAPMNTAGEPFVKPSTGELSTVAASGTVEQTVAPVAAFILTKRGAYSVVTHTYPFSTRGVLVITPPRARDQTTVPSVSSRAR